MKEYIAFDIGGTQIKYGIVSETGTVLKHKAVPTEIHLGGTNRPKAHSFIKKLMNEHTISGIGISTAGIVNIYKGIVTGGVEHIPNYATIPIIDRLQEVLKVPVSIDNDVNCARSEKSGTVLEEIKETLLCSPLELALEEQFYRWRVI